MKEFNTSEKFVISMFATLCAGRSYSSFNTEGSGELVIKYTRAGSSSKGVEYKVKKDDSGMFKLTCACGAIVIYHMDWLSDLARLLRHVESEGNDYTLKKIDWEEL